MNETQIIKCDSVGHEINIYIKREDLIPFSFGGNKIRIAEEYYNDMLQQGKNCMIGYGNARSNLSRALANICSSRENIPCCIVSPSDDDGKRIDTNNSWMVQSCGVKFYPCSKDNVANSVDEVINKCESRGLAPYYIYGDKYGNGNEAIPVRAYYKVYQEILKQEKEMGIQFDYIFLSTGTGMTQSGLLAGQMVAGRYEQKIVGISVAREQEKEKRIIENFIAKFFKDSNHDIKAVPEIIIDDDYLCGGYGKYSADIIHVIRDIFIEHGIPLDPTYTGKGYHGMLQYLKCKKIKNANVLFIHTGGTPLFFDNIKLLQEGID